MLKKNIILKSSILLFSFLLLNLQGCSNILNENATTENTTTESENINPTETETPDVAVTEEPKLYTCEEFSLDVSPLLTQEEIFEVKHTLNFSNKCSFNSLEDLANFWQEIIIFFSTQNLAKDDFETAEQYQQRTNDLIKQLENKLGFTFADTLFTVKIPTLVNVTNDPNQQKLYEYSPENQELKVNLRNSFRISYEASTSAYKDMNTLVTGIENSNTSFLLYYDLFLSEKIRRYFEAQLNWNDISQSSNINIKNIIPEDAKQILTENRLMVEVSFNIELDKIIQYYNTIPPINEMIKNPGAGNKQIIGTGYNLSLIDKETGTIFWQLNPLIEEVMNTGTLNSTPQTNQNLVSENKEENSPINEINNQPINQQITTESSNSQTTLPSSLSPDKCSVTNIKTGQLAVRKNPNGESIAGLDNDNVVQYLKGENPWFYIRVINGPNSQVDGKEGWVNANYLNCQNN
ncbi:SH3 domain-containing protein [Geminocystis sp. CENA526]|uniref:SH3 domain-containing protein n=1 Tax=Geminocystis sp. CENA526 TaxID=1355871 RepID=UPI003D6EDE2E